MKGGVVADDDTSYYPYEQMNNKRPIFQHLSDLADPTRVRLLATLENQFLTVSELQAVLQLPQSTTSRHLRVLTSGAWVSSQPDGTSHRYRFDPRLLPQTGRDLWKLVREELRADGAGREDQARLQAVLAERTAGRRARSREYFATAGPSWDRARQELFGPRYERSALLGLLEASWAVADLGCGGGHLAQAMAPFVRRVVAIDESPEMLAVARPRLAGLANVEVRQGELELLPLGEAELDLATLVLVLPYVPDPGRLMAEAARALQPGGRLLIVDLQRHGRVEYEQEMGHLWPGFDLGQIQAWLQAAGLRPSSVVALPPDPAAKGPGLFVATACKPPSPGA